MFFKFTFVFTWLKLSVKKGSKQNKTKKQGPLLCDHIT